jgi:hypothetical protein
LSIPAQDPRGVSVPSGMEAEGHKTATSMRLLRYDRWCRSRQVSVLPYMVLMLNTRASLIVVLLVVLRMTVEEAMNEFEQMWLLVFADDSLKPAKRSSKLKAALQDLFRRHNMSPNQRLLSTRDNGCKGCVCRHSFNVAKRLLTASFAPLHRNP